jgi:hypothetical protein
LRRPALLGCPADAHADEEVVQFLSTVAVIAPDPLRSRRLYVDALGVPLQRDAGAYQHSEQIGGCKSFGIWPLSQAAEACFGTTNGHLGVPCPR